MLFKRKNGFCDGGCVGGRCGLKGKKGVGWFEFFESDDIIL